MILWKAKKERGERCYNYPNKMGVRSWRKMSRDRAARKLILKEAKVLQGPWTQ
jgi:hypothetical protein